MQLVQVRLLSSSVAFFAVSIGTISALFAFPIFSFGLSIDGTLVARILANDTQPVEMKYIEIMKIDKKA